MYPNKYCELTFISQVISYPYNSSNEINEVKQSSITHQYIIVQVSMYTNKYHK